MKYLYVTTTQQLDTEAWYRFGRYTLDNDQIVESTWSDDLKSWDTSSYFYNTSYNTKPPYDLGHKTIQEFLDDPTTLVYKRPSDFYKHHPELFI